MNHRSDVDHPSPGLVDLMRPLPKQIAESFVIANGMRPWLLDMERELTGVEAMGLLGIWDRPPSAYKGAFEEYQGSVSESVASTQYAIASSMWNAFGALPLLAGLFAAAYPDVRSQAALNEEHDSLMEKYFQHLEEEEYAELLREMDEEEEEERGSSEDLVLESDSGGEGLVLN